MAGKQYHGSELGNQVLAIGLAHAPSLTHASAEMLFPCVISSFFANCGVHLSAKQISNVCPNHETISNIVANVGANAIVDMKAKLKLVSDIYLACDKGNKRSDTYFVKVLCWWCREKKRIDKLVLDVDGAEGTLVDAATSIDKSLQKIDGDNNTFRAKNNLSSRGG